MRTAVESIVDFARFPGRLILCQSGRWRKLYRVRHFSPKVRPVFRFVHAAMLSVMLLHSILGCCWHHGHTHSATACLSGSNSERPESSRIHTTHSHRLHHTCSHHHTPSQSPADHDQVPHHHQCDQDDCHFLLTKTWQFPDQLELSLAFVTDTRADVLQSLPRTLVTQNSEPEFETAGIRCAVLQVWRI
jgi:hypothetical protein